MTEKKKVGGLLRLRSLEIKNFKAIDQLKLDFLPPRMKADPDIYVMGSRNGLGKTSILEACALLFLVASAGEDRFHNTNMPEIPANLSELFIHSDSKEASFIGVFSFGEKEFRLDVKLNRSGRVSVVGDVDKIKKMLKLEEKMPAEVLVERFFLLLAGYNMEPFIMPTCLYFHSFRKVQEGNPELGMMVEPEMSMHRRVVRTAYGRKRIPFGEDMFVSAFKLQILRAMMGRANLFERLENSNADETLEKLNGLIMRYAGGSIDKLRPSPDNTVDFRVSPRNGGASFAFDGLSSGQKEIISTLFLIWHYTKNHPCIVLIDEPELHLNAEWHRDFVQQVFNLAPDNQYIVATHSEDVFKSVNDDRRLFLGEGEGGR